MIRSVTLLKSLRKSCGKHQRFDSPSGLPGEISGRDDLDATIFSLSAHLLPHLWSPLSRDLSKILEGETYFEVAIPVTRWMGRSISQEDWTKLSEFAGDMASVVGLCLNQRTVLKKVAEYASEITPGQYPRSMEFRWEVHVGARASVSKRSSRSIQRAILTAMNEQVPPKSQAALSWYEHSKCVTVGADRLVALWIALKALMGESNHTRLVRKTAEYLAHKDFRLGLDSPGIVKALGLGHIRELWNKIVHQGVRWVPWPVSGSSKEGTGPRYSTT